MSMWFWLLLLPAIGWDLGGWHKRREDARFRVLQKEHLDWMKDQHRKNFVPTIPTGINAAYRSLVQEMETNPHQWVESTNGKRCQKCGTECVCPDYCKHNMF